MSFWPQTDIDASDSPVTVTVDDRAFWCDTSAGNIIVDLPTAVNKPSLYFVFKKETSDSNTITVNAPSGKTIDGSSSFILTQFNQIIGVVTKSDGNYKIVDGNSSGSAVGVGRSYVNKTDGAFGLSGRTQVTGTTLSVTLPVDGDVVVTVSGTASYSGQPTSFGLGVRVDSITDYFWTANESLVGSGSDYFHNASFSHRFVIPSMTKGVHVFSMIAAGNNMSLLASSESPASMVIEYVNVVNFGGGNPTSDPTNDLGGTWDTVQVVGLQDDLLPAKTAGGFLRRNMANTSWEYVTDITNVRLDEWKVPTDVTRLNVSSSYHGLTPKLPLVGGAPDVTNFLRADGTWSTPPGSGSGGALTEFEIDVAKSYFTTHSLLPATVKYEVLDTFPARDFEIAGTSNTLTFSESQATWVSGGTNRGLFGWDLGASRSKVLIVMHIKPRFFSGGIMACNTLPTTDLTSDDYFFALSANTNDISIFKAGTSFTSVVNTAQYGPVDTAYSGFWQVALYCAANVQKAFIRQGNERWTKVLSATDGTTTSFRYVGAVFGPTTTRTMWYNCPLGVWYTA